MFDVNQLLAGLTQSAAQQQQLNTQMQKRLQQDDQQINALNQQQQAQAQALIEASKSTADKEAEVAFKIGSSQEANVALAGLSDQQLDNAYVSSLAAYDAAERDRRMLFEDRQALEAQAVQMQSVDLLSNPLQYLVGQLALPQVMGKATQVAQAEQASIDRRNAAATDLKTRVDLVKARNSIITTATAQDTLDINKAKAAQAAANAQLSLQQATIDNISKSGARAMDQYRLANDSFEIQDKLINKSISIAQWQVAQQEAAANRAERAAAAQARAEAKNAQQQEIDDQNARLAAVSSALGYAQPLTLQDLKRMDARKANAIYQAAMTGDFGANLGDSLALVKGVGNVPGMARSNPGMGKMVEWTDNAIRAEAGNVAAAAQRTGQKLKPEEVQAQATAQYTSSIVGSAHDFKSPHALNSERFNDSGIFNPYKPQYLALSAAVSQGKFPTLKDNAALGIIANLKAELGPGETNLRGKHMETLVQVMAKQVADGKLSVDKAATDLTALHREAARFNYDTFNYVQLGLPQQKSAIITLPPQAMFDKPYQIDLMNPAITKKELVRMAARSKATGGLRGFFEQTGVPETAAAKQQAFDKLFK